MHRSERGWGRDSPGLLTSSIWIAQNVERKMRNFLGHKFWARGYFVTTVGRDEEALRAYIRNQELAETKNWPTSNWISLS